MPVLPSLQDNGRVEVEAGTDTEQGQLDHNANEYQALTDGREHEVNMEPNQGETRETLGHRTAEEKEREEQTVYYTMNTCKENQAVTIKKYHNDSEGMTE